MDKDFFALYDQNLPKFEWFIRSYFGEGTLELMRLHRKNEDRFALETELNKVWYYLPDSRFNIMKNPEGWSEFIEVLEF